METPKNLIPIEKVEKLILIIRGHKVMLDRDLAKLYGVLTKVLNQAVKRNIDRFPEDFMFRLSQEEASGLLRSQIVTLEKDQHYKHLPYVFTENGVAMLSSVLNSKRAIAVNIQIMRTFTKLREMLRMHAGLKQKIDEMEKKYDYQFKVVFEAIRQLMTPPERPRKKIGFRDEE